MFFLFLLLLHFLYSLLQLWLHFLEIDGYFLGHFGFRGLPRLQLLPVQLLLLRLVEANNQLHQTIHQEVILVKHDAVSLRRVHCDAKMLQGAW
jgi:hypothetical protein